MNCIEGQEVSNEVLAIITTVVCLMSGKTLEVQVIKRIPQVSSIWSAVGKMESLGCSNSPCCGGRR